MTVHDEVCGMDIAREGAVAQTEFQGERYYFCSERCCVKFEENPGWYVPVRQDTGGEGAD